MMQRLGFIHDMLDVKVLILFVMARVSYPVNVQQIYELCYQPNDVRKMIELGAELDSHDGKLHMTLEGGHCRRRIVHHRDTTGEELMRTAINTAKSLPNVDIEENTVLAFLD